jgi:hypothetical protein
MEIVLEGVKVMTVERDGQSVEVPVSDDMHSKS